MSSQEAAGTQRHAPGWDPDALSVLLASFTGTDVPGWLHEPLRAGLGGVVLFGYNTPDAATTRDLARQVHAIAPDALVAIDEEGGDVTRIQAADGSDLPTAWALGAIDDPDLTRRVGKALGDLLAACDIDLDLAPVLDVSTDPRNPVIGTRAFGDEPALVARHAEAFADGLHDATVGACGKHFPGHGATHVDSHTALPAIDLPADDLQRTHLAPWRISPQLDAIMTAHVLVPRLGDGPASISPWSRALLDELAGPPGYRGLVVTDALDMAAVAADPGYQEAVVRAIEAGSHLLCLGTSIRRDEQDMLREAHDALVDAVETGRLDRAVLHARAEETRALAHALRERRRAGRGPDLDTALHTLRQVGAHAARRAVHAGTAHLGEGSVAVVDARVRHDHASGSRRSTLGDILREHGIDTVETTDMQQIPADTAQVLVLTRLPLSDPDEQERLAAILAARPEAIILHTGVPGAAPAHEQVVLTYGHGRAMITAAVDALRGTAGRTQTPHDQRPRNGSPREEAAR